MTPQAAALTVHEHEALDALSIDRLSAPSPGAIVPFPVRRHPAAEDTSHALAWLPRRDARHRRLLSAADMIACALAVMLVLGTQHNAALVLLALPLAMLSFKVAGLYDRDQMRLVYSTLDELPALLQITGLLALGVTIVESLVMQHSLAGERIAALWLVTFLMTAAARVAARWVGVRIGGTERCLVIGDPDLADRIRDKLATSSARADVVATLPLGDTDSKSFGDTPDDLRWLVDHFHLDRIIIAPTTTDAAGVAGLIRASKAAGVRVNVLPRMLEVIGSSVEFDDIDGMTMLAVRPFGLPRSSRALKRGFDLLVTSLGLLLAGPILAVIALAILLDSRGPVLFRQVRVGRDGRHFYIFKFRSMVVDAEAQKEQLRALNEVCEGDGGMFKLTHDPRVTRVGAILRKTSLDELPQLFNVLRGEMSLVGPRPLVTEEDEQVHGLDRSRLHLTPGMTGPWQVLGTRVPMREMVGLDYLYVANWSLWQDLKLLMRTVRHVARSGNV
jgi:exopolysaccharide biosynthesis polyprenyl glycosylphosphotransferase